MAEQAQNGTRAPAKGRAKRPMIIDFHAHAHIPAVDEYIKANMTPDELDALEWGLPKDPERRAAAKAKPIYSHARAKATDPKAQLADMDERGIDVHVISMNFPHQCYDFDLERGRKVTRICNEGLAEFASHAPDRFAAVGVIPMQDEAAALEELDYAVDRLGLKGIGVTSHAAGRELGDRYFWKVWERVQELDIPVFIHPQGFTQPQRLDKFGSFNVIGQPLEEALAMVSLIHEGVIEAFPNIKFCVAHGGGYLPYYCGRSDSQYDRRPEMRANIPHKPSYYIEKFYCDTVIWDQRMLEFLVDKVGSDHVLNGTDYPYVIWDSPAFVRSARISKEAKENILWKNAARLLKLSI